MDNIKYKCAYDELVDTHKLIPNPKNPNKHPKSQIDALAYIIDHQGQRSPVVVSNRSGFIIKGHGRLQAIKQLGWDKVAVDYQDYDSEAQEYADMIADNKIAELAEHDDGMMIADLKGFPEMDLNLLGMPDFKMPDEIAPPVGDPDEVPDVKKSPVVKGEVYILGNHRLMCGDSTMIDDVEKLMNGEKADMVFTDPPYGVSYTGGLKNTKTGLASNNRVMIKNDDVDLYENAVEMASIFCDGPVFMFYADSVPFGLYRGIERVGGQVVALLIWKKPGGYGALGASYKLNMEPCVLWKKKKSNLKFIGPSTETRIWEHKKDGVNKLHPTQKPVEISQRAISNHDCKVVLDLFGGSGSTLIACESIGRHARIMELDPIYCAVILERWQKYTGKKAHREDGKLWDEIRGVN
jgi:DNA modification methylase